MSEFSSTIRSFLGETRGGLCEAQGFLCGEIFVLESMEKDAEIMDICPPSPERFRRIIEQLKKVEALIHDAEKSIEAGEAA